MPHMHAGHRCVHMRIRLQAQVDVCTCASKLRAWSADTDAKRATHSIYISTGAHGQAYSASESGLRC